MCRVCARKRVDDYRSSWPGKAAELFRHSRDRAKSKNIEYSLTKEWILQQIVENNHKCAATGIDMITETRGLGVGFLSKKGPSLDRVDPKLGYTKDNVRIVCNRFNIAKGNLSDHEIEEYFIGFLQNRGYVVGHTHAAL